MTDTGPDSELDVLVVEDNPGDINILEEALETSAFPCSYAVVNDGEAAVNYLGQRDEYASVSRPDLVLLDLNVPKVPGRDVLEEIRTGCEMDSVPVVVFSGSKTPDDVQETYELGADGYFTKPVDPMEFMSLVRSVGESLATDGGVPSGEYADIEAES